MGAKIHQHIPDDALQAGDEFRLAMRLVLIMQSAQGSLLAREGKAVLGKVCFQLPFGKGRLAIDPREPAALVLRRSGSMDHAPLMLSGVKCMSLPPIAAFLHSASLSLRR